MKTMHAAAIAFTLGLGACAAQAAASYDTTSFVILDGYVKGIDWSGSQLKVVFHSNDGYDGADWTLQGPSPRELKALGWKQDAVKAGDRIDAVVHADASGAPNGQLLRFLLPDYRTLETSAYGSSLLYPKGAIKKAYVLAAEDPLAIAYGNTLACTASESKPPDANHSCRVWINADHTIRVVRKKTFNGLNADGSFNLATDTGFWWLEKQRGKLVLCSLIDDAPMPHCDMAVVPRKLGEKWTVTVHGAKADWTENWVLEQGRSH